MAYETLTFKNELDRLEASRDVFIKALLALRTFIISLEFLINFTKFEELMGTFQDSVITLVESINMPGSPGLPPFEAAKQIGRAHV